MEKNQEINCNVFSCKYNNVQKGKCKLQSIQIEPLPENDSLDKEESMCSNYQYYEE